MPIQRVQAVLGVLTLEAGDVDQIVAAQRWALMPFILIAFAVTLASSILANITGRPPHRDACRGPRTACGWQRVRTMSLPDLADRDDEVGDLTRSLEAMTGAHSPTGWTPSTGSPPTSATRSKTPSPPSARRWRRWNWRPPPQAQARLLPILKHDVGRLDRLITDISNASRLDAELSRDAPRAFDIDALLRELTELYAATRREGEAAVAYAGPGTLP